MSNSPSVETTDIVTVIEEGQSNRAMWKLRKVLDVYPAGDGLVRGATIEVASSKASKSVLGDLYRNCFR